MLTSFCMPLSKKISSLGTLTMIQKSRTFLPSRSCRANPGGWYSFSDISDQERKAATPALLLRPGADRAGGTGLTVFESRFRTTHRSLRNFWVPIQTLSQGGDYATLLPHLESISHYKKAAYRVHITSKKVNLTFLS